MSNTNSDRKLVYAETLQENSRYKLCIYSNNSEEQYWNYIFRKEESAHELWVSVNAGGRRIKRSGSSIDLKEDFELIPPSSYRTLDEAITKGRSLLILCVENEITFDEFYDIWHFQHR